jgi:hypothetical protein
VDLVHGNREGWASSQLLGRIARGELWCMGPVQRASERRAGVGLFDDEFDACWFCSG